MQRETWMKRMAAGAAVVALGWGGMWFFIGPDEEAQVVAAQRPVKVVTAKPVTSIKPKSTMSGAAEPEPRQPRPPHQPEADGGRKGHSARNTTVEKSKPKTAA